MWGAKLPVATARARCQVRLQKSEMRRELTSKISMLDLQSNRPHATYAAKTSRSTYGLSRR